ncbi:MAG: hypothetical protein GQ475_02810 [Methylococcaceae bacterium]|nr:hypothetical protein [Methylococcaceae bacterium]
MIHREIVILLMLLAVHIAGCGKVIALDLQVDGLRSPKRAQISSLAILEDRLILLPQHEQGIYWVSLNALDTVIQAATQTSTGHSVISVNFTEFKGTIPELSGASGWEALDVGGSKGGRTLFLAHEDAEGHHAIFRAKVRINNTRIDISPLDLHRELPLPKTPNTNYAYEALVWFSDDELIAIPELSDNFTHGVRFSLDTQADEFIALQKHKYRITDVTSAKGVKRHILCT